MINNGIGAKRHVVGAHYGLKEWIIQRVTAVIMAIFTIILLAAFFINPNNQLLYIQWSSLFANPFMQILTFLSIASLCYHAWIGIRDIWMDYVKPVSLRLTLYILTILWLLGCLAYCAKILWRFA